MSGPTTVVPGVDAGRLHDWIRRHLPDAPEGELAVELVTGGRSNLTYRLCVGDEYWILRRPPLGHVLATAHDMGREYRVMAALASTDVPVPRTIASCDDPHVLGAPFYLMAFVPGTVFRRRQQLVDLGPARARRLSEALVDVLVGIHAVDHRAVGLQDFGRPDGYLQRQVSRWRRQLEASYTRDLPDAQRLHSLLSERVPPTGPVGVVHGDYRLDNVIIEGEDTPAAVIDWEMSTIGDQLSDLALTVVYMRLEKLAMDSVAIADASSAEGFLGEAELLERYASLSGQDLAEFGFYLGLASFKLAGILEGIHFRFLQGQTVGAGFEELGALTEPLLAAGLASIKEIS